MYELFTCKYYLVLLDKVEEKCEQIWFWIHGDLEHWENCEATVKEAMAPESTAITVRFQL